MRSGGTPPGRRARPTVMLVLPRADHLRRYGSLVRALGVVPEIEAVVVTSPGLADTAGAPGGVAWDRCPFYRDGAARGVAGWMWLLARREWTARSLLHTRRPAALVVPSDVADATLAFVAAARRRGVPVVYVQGAVVFADYPRLNAQTHGARRQALSRARRVALEIGSRALALCGIHAAIETKEVLGSRADRVLVMNSAQAEVHRRAGVPADRISVTGAPFLDELVTLRQRFGTDARNALRKRLGLADQPIALFVTKSRFSVSATRDAHEAVIRDVVSAVRRELPGWTCVVKLHPAESMSDYAWLVDARNPFVAVVKDEPVEELILLADLTLCLGTSSPALTATLLGSPLVLLSLTGSSMLEAHAELVRAATTVRSAAELDALLRRVGDDPETLGRLKVPSVLDEAAADGRACERIVAHLRDIAGA